MREPLPTLIYEPRCKICRSQHRLAIDGMLLEGRAQAEVIRYWNAQRLSDWLASSGMSRHATRHLDRPVASSIPSHPHVNGSVPGSGSVT
jgi:hypothetical protein